MPRILKIDPHSAEFFAVRPAIDLLLAGGVAAGPTQTYYGLWAAADRPEALERIIDLKGRDGDKPLLLLIDQTLRVACYAGEAPAGAAELINRFWPGPLTLLFHARPELPQELLGPAHTVGMRVEGLASVRTLVRAMDRAVTGTSANPSGQPPAKTAEEVKAYFGDAVDMILDGGPCPGGEPSTIIDVSLEPPLLVRDGSLSLDEILAVAPNLRI